MPVGAYWDSDNKMFYTLTGNADGSVLTINKNNLKMIMIMFSCPAHPRPEGC